MERQVAGAGRAHRGSSTGSSATCSRIQRQRPPRRVQHRPSSYCARSSTAGSAAGYVAPSSAAPRAIASPNTCAARLVSNSAQPTRTSSSAGARHPRRWMLPILPDGFRGRHTDLRARGLSVSGRWFAPHFEFRYPAHRRPSPGATSSELRTRWSLARPRRGSSAAAPSASRQFARAPAEVKARGSPATACVSR